MAPHAVPASHGKYQEVLYYLVLIYRQKHRYRNADAWQRQITDQKVLGWLENQG